MDIALAILGTIVFLALWPVLANIWTVSPFTYYAARWAVALWVLTLDAALWYGVYLTH